MADNYVDAAHTSSKEGGRHRERRIVSWGEGARPRAIGAPQTARQDETRRGGGDSNIKLIYACVSASHTNT